MWLFLALAVCEANNGCEYACNVVDGQDTCICEKGYELNTDGLTCKGKSRRLLIEFTRKIWVLMPIQIT